MALPTIAFFGATGGCAGYCLASALKAGHKCSALARTPSKLTTSLKEKGVSDSSLQNLTIIQGDAKDISACAKTLSAAPNGAIVDTIVSGIGGYPKLQWSITQPVVGKDPTLCAEAGAALLAALSQLQPSRKPLLINISTTGITHGPRDVPLAYYALYHWLLSSPHADKRATEAQIAAHMHGPSPWLRAYIHVKPTLLSDGQGKGVRAVRAGVEAKPAIGYVIARKDVGAWMYEKLIEGTVPKEWENQGMSLTT